MAIVTINDEHLTNIAAAIREKNGTTDTYKPGDMAAAIAAIEAGSGSTGYRDYYVSCKIASSAETTDHFVDFDVTNASTFTFTYDYGVSTNSSSVPSLDMYAYLGYKVGLSTTSAVSTRPTQIAVDSGAKSQTLCSSLQTGATGVVVTLDVSNYTTITLRCAPYAKTNGTTSYGYVYIYDITLNQEVANVLF